MAEFKRLVRKLRRAVLRDEPTYYDMFENQGERFFAKLYLHQIENDLNTYDLEPPLRILDAGCQAGRLAIPLALAGHQVTGVDTSGLGLRRANRHAKATGTSLHLIHADLTQWLPAQAPGQFDAVLCTEVLYLRQNYRTLLEGLIRVLRPGRLCFISHRPTSYYLAEAFQRRDSDAVRTLLTAKEGTLFGSYYNWQDHEGLLHLYAQLDVESITVTPIGVLSWLVVNPEDLDETGQELLFQAELALQGRYQGLGRYLLVSARKRS